MVHDGWRARVNRWIYWPIEAALLFLIFGLFRLVPIDPASAAGGAIARTIGPRLRISRRARKNLRAAFPEKDDAEINRIVRGMWENFGRVFAEYPHLANLDLYNGDRVEVIGAENIDLLRDDGAPGIFFSAHLGNWEVCSLSAAQRGCEITQIYRPVNNRIADHLLRYARRTATKTMLPKGRQAARGALELLRGGGHLALLVDQKMNEGLPIPFFGRDAMTAPALAALALKFRCPVIPARCERLKGARFRMWLYPPMALPDTGATQADVVETMTRVNRIIEGWIRDHPEQWLWLHRRWPDS